MAAPIHVQDFSFPDAKKLIDQSETCITGKEIDSDFALPPRFIGKENDFVKTLLNDQMGRFSRKLEAIPIGYTSVRPIGANGVIVGERSLVYFRARINYIIFNPQLGDHLPAVINKLSESHIGLLAHSRFNVWIDRRNCGRVGISVGDEVLVEVLSTEIEKNRIMSINASFVKLLKKSETDANSKNLLNGLKSPTNSSNIFKPPKTKPNKHVTYDDDDDEQDHNNETQNQEQIIPMEPEHESTIRSGSPINIAKKKKRKRDRTVSNGSDSGYENDSHNSGTIINHFDKTETKAPTETHKKSKKKKRKLSQNVE